MLRGCSSKRDILYMLENLNTFDYVEGHSIIVGENWRGHNTTLICRVENVLPDGCHTYAEYLIYVSIERTYPVMIIIIAILLFVS